jgi:hypothetical protein
VTGMLPEPTVSAEDPQSQIQEVESFTPEQVLAFVRDVAARRDSALAHYYRTMAAGRVKDGVEVVLQLLEVHLELKRRYGRGARTGSRAHAAEIRRLLDSTNSANLVAAAAYLESAYGVLPPSRARETVAESLPS